MNKKYLYAFLSVLFIGMFVTFGVIQKNSRDKERLFEQRTKRLAQLEMEDIENSIKVVIMIQNDDFSIIGCSGAGVDDLFIKEICQRIEMIPVVCRSVDSRGTFGLSIASSSITRESFKIISESNAHITELWFGNELTLTDDDIDDIIRSYFITSFPFHNRYCVSLKSYVFSVTEGRIIYEKAGICNRQGTDG